jgi:putative transposase
MRFRKSAHSVYRTQYHVVWTPRYRRKLVVSGVKEYLESMLQSLEGLDGDIEVKKVNVRVDHVHLVVIIPPRLPVANVVQFMKAQTAAALKAKYGFMRKAIYGRPGIWSKGYCVSSIGLNEQQIMNYVQYQEKEDKGQLSLDFD